MSKKIPHGEPHLDCPFWQKPMSEVCHKCPMWVEVRGTNPQTEEIADDWNCALAWAPMLAINIAQQARQTAAAVESFRNVSVRSDQEFKAAVTAALMGKIHQHSAVAAPDKSILLEEVKE